MKPYAFVCLLVVTLLTTPPAEAQQAAKVPRIGFLGTGSASAFAVRLDAFRLGLRERDHIEGQNIIIKYRWAEGKTDRLPHLAAELVRLNVDIIVATGTPGALAAQGRTRTIPVVMTNAGDPVGVGLVTSLARPGGNITGLTHISPELSGKRLELLKEAIPHVVRVAALYDPADPAKIGEFKEAQAAGRALGIQIQSLEVRSPADFEGALAAATRGKADALLVFASGLTNTHRKRIVELATINRLVTLLSDRSLMDAGALMSYGANYVALYRRAAYYVDRILKGASPTELPVEQPTMFELVLNLKTAKAVGLKIPPSLLLRGDHVID